MATSASTNYTHTRDSIITRALRIIGAIGQGETPTATQISEASVALNDLTKRFITDGMQIWKRNTITIVPIAATRFYTVGIGQVTNSVSPLRILEAFYRNSTTNVDTPMLVVENYTYQLIGNKLTAGTPNQITFEPPKASTGELTAVFTVYPVPDATFVANNTIIVVTQNPIEDFDSTGDNPDFPNWWYNAIVWNLADQLTYEYGSPFAERSMISKKAGEEWMMARSFDQEDGSVFIQPDWQNIR